MKPSRLLLGVLLLLTACGAGASETIPIAQLPDPAIYALTPGELPEVGSSWQQTYDQSTSEQGYRWAYVAYQATQPAGAGGLMPSAYAINNDVILYEVDMRREALPQPPSSLGDIQGIAWKPAAQLHKLGDKSAVWKTALGDLLTPVYWLEFYQGHAYVRLSLFGFPEQIALSYIYGLADVLSTRLPHSVEALRTDAATPAPTRPPIPTAVP